MEKIYGINAVREAIKAKKTIEKIEVYKEIKKITIKELLTEASKNNIKINYVGKKHENSQGIVAFVNDFDYYIEIEELLEKVLQKEKSLILILDQIQDPRNFGAIIRSAECFGVDGIIIQDRNSVPVNSTVIKTSTGAIEYVDIVQVKNLSVAIEKLKKYNYFIYGAEANGDTVYNEEEYPNRKALILGSEGKGMRKKIKENCDKVLRINLKGKVNSLNVSVAGGIILSEMNN